VERLFTLIFVASGLAVCASAPVDGQAVAVAEDHSLRRLYLDSREPVVTWDHDGVRVFVAPEGATIRQGAFRLVAPRMVVWFREGGTAASGTAFVTVYAEGEGEPGGRATTPVLVADGDEVSEHAAMFVELRCRSAFVSRCSLERPAEPPHMPLLARAEAVTTDLGRDTAWELIPQPGEVAVAPPIPQVFSSDVLHIFAQEGAVVRIGDVRARYGDLRVRADAAVLWHEAGTDSYELYAEGDVRVWREPDGVQVLKLPPELEGIEVLRADRLYVNPSRGRGLVESVEMRLRPFAWQDGPLFVVRAGRMFAVDRSTLLLDEISATTCPFARPHYQIEAARAEIVAGQERMPVAARDVRFEVGEGRRTFLWIPFLGYDLSRRHFLLTDIAGGSSDKFGAYLQTAWAPLDVIPGQFEWIGDWDLFLDYYSDRGPAIGSELAYAFDGAGISNEGRIRAYYVQDTGDEDDTGLPVPRTDRGRFHVEHRSQLSPAWRVDAEYYHLSDSGFLNEYFEDDFEEEKTPESYVLLRMLAGSTYMGLLYKDGANDFITEVAQRPELAVEFVGVPLGRLVYEGAVRTGRFDLEPDDELMPEPLDPPELTRTHTDHRLSVPFTAGMLRLDPFARAVGTWAGEAVMSDGTFGGSADRVLVGGGVDASTTFWRVFGGRSDALQLNRLRHIVTPHAGIERLSHASGDHSGRFIQMDATDALDSGTVTTVGLRNRLQTKRLRKGEWRSVDWMELDVTYVEQDSDSVSEALDRDFVRADFELRLTDRVRLHSRDNRVAVGDGADVLNAGMTVDFLPRWALSLDFDRISDLNSTLTSELTCRLSDRYDLILYEQYELDSRGTGREKNLETRVTLRRIFHQWALDLGLKIEEANDDVALLIGFGPLSWGIFSGSRGSAR